MSGLPQWAFPAAVIVVSVGVWVVRLILKSRRVYTAKAGMRLLALWSCLIAAAALATRTEDAIFILGPLTLLLGQRQARFVFLEQRRDEAARRQGDGSAASGFDQ